MNFREQLTVYKEMALLEPREIKIQETVNRSKETFFQAERKGRLSYHEFLWAQLGVIQKRWWLLQFLLLAAMWAVLAEGYEEQFAQRGMGVMASLFVILIIPEFWKNRASQSMEIEAACYYSLRQVYAARMLLFGVTDLLMVAIFCQAASAGLHVKLQELVVQFLLPLSVTACICFWALCSKHCLGEAAAIALCVMWSAVWLCIVLNENVYGKVAFPVWLGLLGLAFACMAALVYRTLKYCNEYVETSFDRMEVG